MTRDLRIVFMGTPHFAVGVLQRLVDEHKNIVGVITAPDKPAGRGRKLKASAVKEYAMSKGLPILQPTNLKSLSFLEELKNLNANLQIVIAFRMLPKVVWKMPIYGTFNLHASLLPHYRGAAPINWVIINGEKETGATTFFIDEKIDTGATLLSERIAIENRDTAGSLHDKLMKLGSRLVIKTIRLIEEDKTSPLSQPKSEIFKEAPKLTPENTKINWKSKGKEIDRLIRGLSPYPTAWSTLVNNGEELKIKLYESDFIPENHSDTIGAVIINKKELKIVVVDGYISIRTIQLPGKKKMDAPSLLNGYHFAEDAKFV